MRLAAILPAPILLAAALLPAAARAAPAPEPAPAAAAVPAQLDPAQRAAYHAVFDAIRAGRWLDAQLGLDAMAPGPLHAVARAELTIAKGSPRLPTDQLVALLTEAPELPEADAIARLARARGGALDLPPLPAAQPLVWQAGAPRRVHARAAAPASDAAAAALALQMAPLVKGDRAAEAEALLATTLVTAPALSPEAATEWQARIAWLWFTAGDDARARLLAAAGQDGAGEWAVQARWVGALAAWRARDWAAAETGFEGVGARAGDVDLRAAALYWAARADLAAGRPDRVARRLAGAAQYADSFYGQLAAQALLTSSPAPAPAAAGTDDWALLARRPNVRVAAALAEADEPELADRVLRQQARIGAPAEFAALTRLAEALDLPATAVWLAHNCPPGVAAVAAARFPVPSWAPERGWRVERALVLAHLLEESGFRRTAASRAGAYGLMQIMPAAAADLAPAGTALDRAALSRPATNLEAGQRHLERLRDAAATGGLLPKVIAAYNAGPRPVGDWNASVRDGGDPLLYIESIPYWETRGYVTTVLRNYWLYEAKAHAPQPSRAALAQGLWPRFPGLPGAAAVRVSKPPVALAATAGGAAGGAD